MNAPLDARVPSADLLAPAVIETLRVRQREWAASPLRQRLAVIRQLRTSLPAMEKDFTEALLADIRKPRGETIAAELLPVAAACQFLEKRAAGILRTRRVSYFDTPNYLIGEKDLITRKPRGLVGIIGTWNYPMYLNGVQLVQALAAGNAVVWKPSEIAPRTAAVMTTWLRNAGIGDDLIHVLPAEREYGAKLAEADIDYVIFTGHDTTGRKLATRLGERLIPSTLELSGHDACLVLPDADLDLTARGIYFGTTVNSGQTCVSSRRLFVPRSVQAALQEKVTALFAKYPMQRTLAMSNQQASIDKLVAAACTEGATVLIPGDGHYHGKDGSPIVLTEVKPSMAIAREALFAPVSMIMPYTDLNEALAGIRASDYGLALSIFTRDRAQAIKLAAELPCGLATINDVVAPVGHPATPFGGVGRSGWGVAHGAEGLLEMTTPQVISYRTGSFRPHFDPMGSTPATDDTVLSQMLKWEHSPRFGDRLKGFFGLLGAARRAFFRK
jgi:acyl-CoA reductase-like NAD-dependent aldehyde dehydrogenase